MSNPVLSFCACPCFFAAGILKNNILHERMALFSVLTLFAGKRQDDYQIYRSASQRFHALQALSTSLMDS